ncbi:farnesyltransferas-like protein [Lentithecium fluviatile CBS 122367]|uniref:Protein farnesyltransferase/geranylgeranyltransferase type-1 subunit alpha n=1 Tax=Lentithecium fluviatile CBS 122367 TaxID=1168545 RepID=A0A6G1IYS3_9PLEO|nr:farnesyltransferas-like protein [Lentithecium fluviatile CBS 122367]
MSHEPHHPSRLRRAALPVPLSPCASRQAPASRKVKAKMPKFYNDDPAWEDIEPLPQDDGGLHPLAAIAYTDEYSEAMGYLRAVMAKNEFSERVLGLTEHIISMNPAHYTVWLYRAKTLSELHASLEDEITWLNRTALKHLKNYQIWHHRQTVIDALGSPKGEPDFIATMLEQDSKNYHVWSYRQWLVKRFGLFGDDEELQWTEEMICADVRNNSAWNHRWFLVVGGKDGQSVGEHMVKREIDYAKHAIRRAPQNQSPWNYLKGIVRQAKLPLSTLKDFALEFADIRRPDDIYSSHALDLLADIFGEEEDSKEEAKKALDLLATRFDPIRAHYWRYRKGLLEQTGSAGVVA